MKITRRKRLQRYLSFYKNNFHFRPPFQVLVDGTFCKAALQFKINIKDQMPKYLDNEVKLLTTPCVVTEIEKLGSPLYGAMIILKQYNTHRCGHEKKPVSGDKCLMHMVQGNNDSHYMIATQDKGLSDKVRSTAGVPLLYIYANAIIMEKPSEKNEEAVKEICHQKMQLTSYQKDVLQQLTDETAESKTLKPRRRQIKGPNPLSCKKKKKTTANLKSEGNIDKVKRKRKRTKLKLAKHVKAVLASDRTFLKTNT